MAKAIPSEPAGYSLTMVGSQGRTAVEQPVHRELRPGLPVDVGQESKGEPGNQQHVPHAEEGRAQASRAAMTLAEHRSDRRQPE